MDNRCCIRKMFDEGCIKGLRLVLSPSGQILATGTSSGIVNLYEMPLKNNYLTPSKVIKNLVTSITEMCFNSSSEILAIASDDKKNALRLVRHYTFITIGLFHAVIFHSHVFYRFTFLLWLYSPIFREMRISVGLVLQAFLPWVGILLLELVNRLCSYTGENIEFFSLVCRFWMDFGEFVPKGILFHDFVDNSALLTIIVFRFPSPWSLFS